MMNTMNMRVIFKLLMVPPILLSFGGSSVAARASEALSHASDRDLQQPVMPEGVIERLHPPVLNEQDLSALNLPVLRQVKVLISNLHLVTPGLLRGAQPSEAALALLKQSGIRTIVNLRNEELLVNQEAAQARALGLNYVNIPMEIFSKPSDYTVQRFLATVTDPNNQPVYVHCQHGEDRTGTLCAIYRIVQQGWPVEKAYWEMVCYGYKPVLVPLSQAVFEYGHTYQARASISDTASSVNDTRNRLQKFLHKQKAGPGFHL